MSKQLFSFDHIKLVEGAEFYELCYGKFVLYKVTKAATLSEDGKSLGWEGVHASQPDAEPVCFLITVGYEHYGPKIYLKDEVEEYNGRLFVSR